MRKIGRGPFQIGTVIALERDSVSRGYGLRIWLKKRDFGGFGGETVSVAKEMTEMKVHLDRFDVRL